MRWHSAVRLDKTEMAKETNQKNQGVVVGSGFEQIWDLYFLLRILNQLLV